jgi:hypothetical protein
VHEYALGQHPLFAVDPHKLPVTIEARDSREILRATGRFGTDSRSYRQLLAYARPWPERIWAVEGANGIGRPLAQRLLASGEQVLDVPAKLAAARRSCQNRPVPRRSGGMMASQTMVSAPCSGERRIGWVSRRNRGRAAAMHTRQGGRR